MRPQNSTLTARRVHRCAAAVLQDHLKLPDHGPKCRAGPLLTLLFYAAARLTSLSDACQSLRDAPSDEAARLALIATLHDFAALQRRLNAALAGNLPRALRRRPQRLAADLVLIPYHGQPLHDPDEIYRSAAKSGTSHFHAYATLYVIRHGYRFTVALTAVGRGEPLEEVLKRLLRQAAAVGKRLLDLAAQRLGHLHPARCPQAVGPGLDLRQMSLLPWPVATAGQAAADLRLRGFVPPSFDWVKETYRQRFAIETTYRQLHQARIRTSTRDPVRRLLHVGIALILRNVWVWLHQMILARPRRGVARSAWTCSDSAGCCCGWRMWWSRNSASATRSRSNFVDDQGLRLSMTTPQTWNY